MLYLITHHCSNYCPHCMNSSRENNEHATMATTQKLIRLIRKVEPKILVVGGGEPTEHPNLFDHIKTLSKEVEVLIVTTNGMFLNSEDYARQYLSMTRRYAVFTQISAIYGLYADCERVVRNVEKYKDRFFDVELITIPTVMDSLGKAKGRKFPQYNLHERKAANCFNIFSGSYSLNIKSLKELIKAVEQKASCKPMISRDGRIFIGESLDCLQIGTLDDSTSRILRNIKTKEPCGKCGVDSSALIKYAKEFYGG